MHDDATHNSNATRGDAKILILPDINNGMILMMLMMNKCFIHHELHNSLVLFWKGRNTRGEIMLIKEEKWLSLNRYI